MWVVLKAAEKVVLSADHLVALMAVWMVGNLADEWAGDWVERLVEQWAGM